MKIVIFLLTVLVVPCRGDDSTYAFNQLDEGIRQELTVGQAINGLLQAAEIVAHNQPIFYANNIVIDSTITPLLQIVPELRQGYDIPGDVILAIEPKNTHITAQIYTLNQLTVIIDQAEYIAPPGGYLVVSISKAALEYLSLSELQYLIARELYLFVQNSHWEKILAPSMMGTFIAVSSFVWSADLHWSLCLSGMTGLLSYLCQGEFCELDKDTFAIQLLGNKNILRSLIRKQMQHESSNSASRTTVHMFQERLDVL